MPGSGVIEKIIENRARIPGSCLVQLAIVITTTTQVLFLSRQFEDFDHTSVATFRSLFAPGDCADGVFEIKDAQECVKKAVKTYYHLQSLAIGNFQYPGKKAAPITMTVVRYRGASFLRTPPEEDANGEHFTEKELELVTETHELTEHDPLGPLNGNASLCGGTQPMRCFFDPLYRYSLAFKVLSTEVAHFGAASFVWDIHVHYSYARRGGKLFTTVEVSRYIYNAMSSRNLLLSKYIAINLATIGLCTVAFAYQIATTRAKWEQFSREHQGSTARAILATMPWWMKLRFLDAWLITSISSMVLLIIASVISLKSVFSVTERVTDDASRVILGLGLLLAYIDLVKYLGYDHKFFVLINTVRRAMPNIGRFMASVFPIFLGFAMCGVMMFSQYSTRFQNISTAMVTLFALLNGDEIRATFVSLEKSPYPFLAQLYLGIFVSFFITTILNLFIFIVEDGYHRSKGHDCADGEANASVTREGERMRDWEAVLEDMEDSLSLSERDVFRSLVRKTSSRYRRSEDSTRPRKTSFLEPTETTPLRQSTVESGDPILDEGRASRTVTMKAGGDAISMEYVPRNLPRDAVGQVDALLEEFIKKVDAVVANPQP